MKMSSNIIKYIDAAKYENIVLVSFVYNTLNAPSSIVDANDTIEYLDNSNHIDRVEECKILTDIDKTGKIRLKTIMCSACHKLFSCPTRKMLYYEKRYYCLSCVSNVIGKRDSIHNFLIRK